MATSLTVKGFGRSPISIAAGGTDSETASEAINSLLPDQTGHAGHVLTSDGSFNADWAAAPAGPTYTAGNLIDPTAFASDVISVLDIIMSDPAEDPPAESVYVGQESGGNASDPHARRNTAVGTKAARDLEQGDDNTLIGNRAGILILDGSRNTAVGSSALIENEQSHDNTVLGYQAGRELLTGSSNVFLGINAGRDITTGNSNVLIGPGAGQLAVTLNNTFIVNSEERSGSEATPYIIGSMVDDSTAYLQIDAAFRVNSPTSGDMWFAIAANGELRLSNDAGTLGEVLTSAGPGLPPTWEPGGGSATDGAVTQVLINDGTGGFDNAHAYFTASAAQDAILTLGTNGSENASTGSIVTTFQQGGGSGRDGTQLTVAASDAFFPFDTLTKNGGALVLKAGRGGSTTGTDRFGTGGTVSLTAGNSRNFPGGGVNITAGINETLTGGNDGGVAVIAGQVGGTGAHFRVVTNTLERLRIGSAGSWNLNQNGSGSLGEIFTSRGSGAPVAWSGPNLLFDNATGAFSLNDNDPYDVPGLVNLRGANANTGFLSPGGSVFVVGGASDDAAGGAVEIGAGNGETGGTLNLYAGNSSANDGANVSINGGTGAGAGNVGGSVNITGGLSGTDVGGGISVNGGIGATLGGNIIMIGGSGPTGGLVSVNGGPGTTGGVLSMAGGDGTTGDGGEGQLRGGASTGGGNGGSASLFGGDGFIGNGGLVQLHGGSGGGATGAGGPVEIFGGVSNDSPGPAGGSVTILGGTSFGNDGGSVVIAGGEAANGVFVGGDVTISGGPSEDGVGTGGKVIVSTAATGENYFERLKIDELGRFYISTTGGNRAAGVATLVAGTVTVANTLVTAATQIYYSVQTAGGTQGFLRISARTAGTSFTITSTSGTETSTVAYLLIEP